MRWKPDKETTLTRFILTLVMGMLLGSAALADEVRSANGALVARISGQEVRSASGSLLYRLDGREVRDANGRLYLRFDGDELRVTDRRIGATA
jgi:hypothetical protein